LWRWRRRCRTITATALPSLLGNEADQADADYDDR
jgi:hypothetical protein